MTYSVIFLDPSYLCCIHYLQIPITFNSPVMITAFPINLELLLKLLTHISITAMLLFLSLLSKDFRKLILSMALMFTLMFCVPQFVSLFPTFEVVYDLSHPGGSKERSASGSSQPLASLLPASSVFKESHLC